MLLIPKAALVSVRGSASWRLCASARKVSVATGRRLSSLFSKLYHFMAVLAEHSWLFWNGVAPYMLGKSSATKLLPPAFNSSLGNKMEI